MVRYYGLCFLFILQGVSCIQFFINVGDGFVCLVEFTGVITDVRANKAQLGNKKCTSYRSNALYAQPVFDYHFTERHMYIVDHETTSMKIHRLSFSFSAEITSFNITSENTSAASRFVIDWIRDRFYLTSGKYLTVGELPRSDHDITLEDVFTQQDLIELCKEEGMSIIDVQIDPYVQKLFLSAVPAPFDDTYYSKKIYIISSDLEGNGKKVILNLQLGIGHKNFNIDIDEKKLYLSYEYHLAKYNYQGISEKVYYIPKIPFLSSVWDNKLYINTEGSDTIHEIYINESTTQLPVSKVYDPQTSVIRGKIDFKVLDIRRQRQKRDDKYICDRTDCPDLCEVRSSGDTCMCRETDAKDRDGVTCYNCGQSNLTSAIQQPTIVNGEVSYPANFPWHVVLYLTADLQAFCGGTLVTSNVVLTAAHCVAKACGTCRPPVINITDLVVGLGKTHRPWEYTEPATIRANVTKIIVHEEYMGLLLNYAHDIALVFLDKKVKPTNYVRPACLDYNLNQLPMHSSFTGYIPGFGYTEECGGTCSSPSDRLQYTTAQVMSFSDCYRASNKIHSSTFHKLTSDKICIGNGSVSAVQKGDSGGGLTLTYHGLHYVVGVVSHKLFKETGDEKIYSFGAFTNVHEYMNWIKQNIPESS